MSTADLDWSDHTQAHATTDAATTNQRLRDDVDRLVLALASATGRTESQTRTIYLKADS